jgi:hypothetical protein
MDAGAAASRLVGSGARIVLFASDEPAAPGQESLVQLVLESADGGRCRGPLYAARHHFAAYDRRRKVSRSARAARKRRTPERLAQLRAHAISDHDEALSSAAGPCAGICRNFDIHPRSRAWCAEQILRLSVGGCAQATDTESRACDFSGNLDAPEAGDRRKRLRSFIRKTQISLGSALKNCACSLSRGFRRPAFSAVLDALAYQGNRARRRVDQVAGA